MQILSHRGYWTLPEQKNSLQAMQNSFINNWGVETDVRDYNESIVISHDVANANNYSFLKLLETYHQNNSQTCLALNIKADGLSELLLKQITEYKIENYFVFDMSIPETLRYFNLGMNVFLRSSEYEEINIQLYKKCNGIWLDAFTEIWYKKDDVHLHLQQGKKIAIVSPELHGRSHLEFWQTIYNNDWHKNNQILLCTDFPLEAKKYFNL